MLQQVKDSNYTFFQGHSTSKPKVYLPDYKEKIQNKFLAEQIWMFKGIPCNGMEKICVSQN